MEHSIFSPTNLEGKIKEPSHLLRRHTSDKARVYFNEYNILMENSVYLPLVSGSLHIRALQDSLLRESYEFMPYIYYRDYPEKIIENYDNPSIAAFSVSMWNANLSMEVARRVKAKYPDCLVVVGGPQIPFEGREFFENYPWVDVSVRSDGENIFSEILKRNLVSRNFANIPSISYRLGGSYVKNLEEQTTTKTLDHLPSPYTEGVFDYLIQEGKIKFQAIVETNRGCPFPCSFCFWGQGGLNSKMRFFSPERVKAVMEWIGKNHIEYVFCADSNFGMHKRDPQIARDIVEIKERYDYPQKFRVCYGKNAEDSVFETAKILSDSDLAKGVTLARQSNDLTTLKINRRKNIPPSMYNELERRYHDADMSTYTELIVGLPGETYESFKKGIEEILQGGVDNQAYIYHAQVFPNTLLGSKEFQQQQGVRVQRVPLTEVHCRVRGNNFILENEDLIVKTNSMPENDWKEATVLSWCTQLFHGLGAAFYLSNYLFREQKIPYTILYEELRDRSKFLSEDSVLKKIIKEFYDGAQGILEGKPRSREVPDFGNLYWDHEEAAFFDISRNKPRFYGDVLGVTEKILSETLGLTDPLLEEIVAYQEFCTPDYRSNPPHELAFTCSIPEYFASFFDIPVPIQNRPQKAVIQEGRDYNADMHEFAQDIIRRRRNTQILYRPRAVDLEPSLVMTAR